MLKRVGALLVITVASLAFGSPPYYEYDKIHLAAQKGDLNQVKTLLDEHPDLINRPARIAHWSMKSREIPYHTPLLEAVQHGHVEVVELLLARGAKVIIDRHEPSSLLLHVAARFGYSDIARVLIEHRAKVNLAGDYFRTDGKGLWRDVTPLHVAAAAGHLDTAKLLIANGADIGKRDGDDKLPADLALDNGQTAIAEFLRAQNKNKR